MVWFSFFLTAMVSAAAPGEIDYTRQIRPILSNHCYQCHGPDAQQRQGGLRLDQREAAMGPVESGGRAIVAGDVSSSLLIEHITSTDPEKMMPPPSFQKPLTKEQIETLSRWIEMGATWKEHWAFQSIQPPTVPEADPAQPASHPIDRFVNARLVSEGLAKSARADRVTLLRRVTIDLTGLPPTPEEIDAFLADQSPEAYARVVDRLLESPRYGEQMARYWLDAARFGDTHGLHLDNYRSMWPYRDWVIGAFQSNMPFDRFTVEQLAGDLLPKATEDQRIATGFNRCNVTTSEGGSIDEEYYVRYTVDRVETTGTVFMGLTLGCAVCHDHKFDPFTQKEFYQLFAYFNNQTEKPMDGNKDDPPPTIRVASVEQRSKLAAMDDEMSRLTQEMSAAMPKVDAAQTKWEEESVRRLSALWKPMDLKSVSSNGGSSLRRLDDGSVLAEGTNPPKDDYDVVGVVKEGSVAAIRLDALKHESLVAQGPGRAENGNYILSEVELEAVSLVDPTKTEKVRFTGAQADFEQRSGDYFAKKTIDGQIEGNNGWAPAAFDRHENRSLVLTALRPFGFEGGTELRIKLRHQSSIPKHAIGRFRVWYASDPELSSARLGHWHLVGPFPAADGASAFATSFVPEEKVDLKQKFEISGKNLKWVQRRDLVDGKVHPLRGGASASYLFREVEVASARRVKFGLGSNDGVKVWLDGKVVLEQNIQRAATPDSDALTLDLSPGVHQLLVKVVNYGGDQAFVFRALEEEGASAVGVSLVLSTPANERTELQQKEVREYYRSKHVSSYQEKKDRFDLLVREKNDLQGVLVPSLVMQERDEIREAYMLVRGEYDKKGEKVERAVPAVLPPLPKDVANDRLGLARWLVSSEHPLTSRVTVNRFWQQFFGTGLVKTTEDFGVQGDYPSHPELLDWLASEFMRTGWDVKALVKSIVLSETYQQSSHVSPEQHSRDPENRMLARGPRYRFDAEVIRDQALFVSGLLVERVGGPSVKPYQPPGIWEAVAYPTSNTANFVRDTGQSLYRRSLYSFWKRTAHPPSMQTFDAPSREQCTVRRARTNTPLQALVLMNDEQFVEASRHLAARLLVEGGPDDSRKLALGFRLVTARWPDKQEQAILEKALSDQKERFSGDIEGARKLISVGESKPNDSLDPRDLAAWTMMANMLLNLHESVTKG
jgi:mono/diheme cytochrome c family protein